MGLNFPVITRLPVELQSCSNPEKTQKVSLFPFEKIVRLLCLNFFRVTSRLGGGQGILEEVIKALDKSSSGNLPFFSFIINRGTSASWESLIRHLALVFDKLWPKTIIS